MADLVNPTVLATGGLMGSGYSSSGGEGMLGAGGGLIGGLLIGSLLGGNGGGLFGGNGRNNLNGTGLGAGDVVTTAHLQSALNGQSQAQNTNEILQNLATIQQLVPEGTAAVQLSAAGNTFALSNQASQGQLQVAALGTALTTSIGDARHNINDNVHAGVLSQLNGQAMITAAITEGRKDVNDNVHSFQNQTAFNFSNTQLLNAQQAAAAALANANSNALAQQLTAGLALQAANDTSAIYTAIRDDGDKTRCLIVAQNDTYLNRIIIEQANALIELRNERHTRESGINVTQTVNQAQAQTQAQQQQQQQFQILGQIAASLAGLTQVAHATNQNVIAGNTGAVQTGAQSANPVNVA